MNTTITTPAYNGSYRSYGAPATSMAPAVQTPPDGPITVRPGTGPRIDQVRYWVGAGITAVMTALVSLIALIVAQHIVHVPVVIGSSSVSAAVYGVSVAGIALLAAALFDGMLHIAPRPLTYFSWLGGIVTVLAALLPFTASVGLHSQIALAATNLVVGLVITLLVPIAASNARPSARA